MPKKASRQFVCQDCGHIQSRWAGKCPVCGVWNSLIEETVTAASPGSVAGKALTTQLLTSHQQSKLPDRVDSGLGELNRVLGGGLVPASLVLLAGEPGIGKSTLLLETAAR